MTILVWLAAIFTVLRVSYPNETHQLGASADRVVDDLNDMFANEDRAEAFALRMAAATILCGMLVRCVVFVWGFAEQRAKKNK